MRTQLGSRRRCFRLAIAAIVGLLLHHRDASGQTSSGAAQPAGGTTSAPAAAAPGSEDRRAAAEAFDQGTARFLRQDFVGAANWFETANRLAPAPSALQSAIQAHVRAGGPEHNARAASLALQLRARYGSDERSMRLATRTLDTLGPQLARVTVRCGNCEVEVDGGFQQGTEFFVAPARHRVVASWSARRTREQTVELRAGAAETLTFEEPPMPVAAVTPQATRPESVATPRATAPLASPAGVPADTSSRGLHPGVFVAGLVVTAAVGAIAIFSWLDAVAQAQALLTEAEQTHVRNEAAEASVFAAENRTTALVIGTGVVGAATLVFLVMTLSGGSSDHPATATNRTSHRLRVAPVFGQAGYQGFALQGTF